MNKKAPNLYGMGLLAYFVTSLGPSSNFLEDLSTILECQINIGGIIEK